MPKFGVVNGQIINIVDITASRHLTKHVQDFYDLSMQYNDLKSLL